MLKYNLFLITGQLFLLFDWDTDGQLFLLFDWDTDGRHMISPHVLYIFGSHVDRMTDQL